MAASTSTRLAQRGTTETTERLTRGVCRLLRDLGYGVLTEFRLTAPRRVDVIALNDATEFVIVEVKSTFEDFRADLKWRDYLPFCDRFFFGVPSGFPVEVLPQDAGLIVADGFDAAIRRPAPVYAVNPTRRRRQLVRFAVTASTRLQRAYDPVSD